MLTNPLAATMLPTPQQPSPMAPAPQAPNFGKNALMSGVGAAIDGFQRGFDPQGWQAGKDQAKADQSEKLKQNIAMLEQVRTLPMEQRLSILPKLSEAIGQQVPESIMSDQEIDAQLAVMKGQAGISPVTPEPMSAYQRAQLDKPLVVSPGQVVGKVEDGQFNEIFAAPDKPTGDGADLRNGGVQSQKELSDGRILTMFRDGTAEITNDPSTGKPAIARQTFGTIMAGDTPYMFSTSRGPGSLQQVIAPTEVGTNAATVAGVEASGKATAEAKVALPAAAMQMQEAMGVISDLRAHKGFKQRYGGIIEATVPPLGGDAAGAQALIDQLGGQAFLQALGSMKGTGPISEREGLAAQASLNRLNNHAMSDADAEKALADFEEHVGNVYLLAQLKAKAPINVASLTAKQRALIAEWARIEGGAQ